MRLTTPTRTRAAALAALACSAAAALAPSAAMAQSTPAAPATEQVVVPEVQRRDLRLPKIPSKDFSFGLLGGTYASENFGSSAVFGLRVGYHLTEDVFVEAAYAQASVSDAAFRQVLPGGVFESEDEKLTYYNVSAGYNLLPGEVFWGRDRAFPTALYLIGGIGSTKLAEQSRQTINFGLGLRVHVGERSAVQVDMRDHLFSLDLLGERRSTQNLELTLGFTYFF